MRRPAQPTRPGRPADAAQGAAAPGFLLAAALLLLALLMALGLAAGSEGWSWAWRDEADLITAIRAPRTLGALLAGALLGLSGALAQGLFRNPLADPYLLGSAAGAGLGVVLVLAAGGLFGLEMGSAAAGALQRLGLVSAAFCGALLGMVLTLTLARGAGRQMTLLLAGVVVGVLLTSLSDLLLLVSPDALRGKQVFLLGTTSFFGWGSVAWLGAALVVVLPLAVPLARVLDALVLGLAAGAEGWSWAWRDEADLITAIRAPRTLGALLAGALLGLSGALAQGLFRNPLADPYLLGSASGATLGVVLVLDRKSVV